MENRDKKGAKPGDRERRSADQGNYSQFLKDKRSVSGEGGKERAKGRPMRDGDKPKYGDKPRGDKPRGDKPSYGDKPRGDKPSYGDKPRGDRPSYGDKPRGDKPRGDKPRGDKPSYGDKPRGDRPSYGDKPRGDRPSYGDKPRGDKPSYGDKPRGDRPSYGDKPRGDRPSYGDKPRGDKPSYGDKPRGDRPSYGDKPRGDRPSYGDKPRGDKPSYGDKPRGDRPSYGDKPRGDKPRGDKPARAGGERRSFNPNFTEDNKLIGGRSDERSERFGADREGSEERQGYGEKRAYSDRDRATRGGERTEGGRTDSRRTDDRPTTARKSGARIESSDKPIKNNYPTYPRPKPSAAIRLNRYLAMSGVSSRREADELIKAGVVSVNGVVVTELGTKVEPEDVVKFNDSVVKGQSKVYILMNKPKGFVTTVDDPHATKTVMDIIKNACNERVYPVGRLDKDSLGVLLFTNDGDLTKRLTHPSHNKKKVYQVMLDKAITKADMEQIVEGVELEDGVISADAISYVGESKREVGIEVHSGRNRVVRRIFEHLGYRVISLDRVYFAGLTKKNIRRGAWRFLTQREVEILKSGQYE